MPLSGRLAGFSGADGLTINTTAPLLLSTALQGRPAHLLAVIVDGPDVHVMLRSDAAEVYADVPRIRDAIARAHVPADHVLVFVAGDELGLEVVPVARLLAGFTPSCSAFLPPEVPTQ